MHQDTIFRKRPFVILFATIAAVTWAFAFPLIKIGFAEFQVASTDTWGKTLFAGTRFFAAGLLLLILAKIMKRDFHVKKTDDALYLLLFTLVNTSFHYFFFYIGLSNCTGSRSAILDSMSTFILILLACVCFKDEHLTIHKMIGCILGFAGIVLINLGHGSTGSGAFTLGGDGMLICSSLCSAFGGILTRVVTKRMDAIVATGVSLGLGGAVMMILALLMGGKLTHVSVKGIFVLVCLVLVSAIGFALYNQLICYNPVGEIAIFNSFIPVMGAILSCILLGEKFYIQYVFAGIFVVLGVYVVNRRGTYQ